MPTLENHTDQSPLTKGETVYLIYLNGPMSIALESQVISSDGNRVTCNGITKIPNGYPFSHNDKKLESSINRDGQEFTEDRCKLHRNLDLFPKDLI